MNPEPRTSIDRELRDLPGEQATHWLRRAELQIEFATAFASALPDDPGSPGSNATVLISASRHVRSRRP